MATHKQEEQQQHEPGRQVEVAEGGGWAVDEERFHPRRGGHGKRWHAMGTIWLAGVCHLASRREI